MCGITGVFNLNGEPVSPQLLQVMTDEIAHRGPDGDGFFREEGMGFGHRRLAIIDLSPAGNQPRMTHDGRYVVTFNGEIFNYRELRVELEALGYQFHSQTDTEVMLEAITEWGLDALLRLNGQFAFALWDRKTKQMILARDRFGVKPIYYYYDGSILVFGSEIKALLKHPRISAEVDTTALGEYFTFQNTLGQQTMFAGIKLLPAGSTLTISAGDGEPQLNQYWDFDFNHSGFDYSIEETGERLYQLFEQAVSDQLVADVPVGSYLSGGMDSGSITAVASRQIPHLHTFSGGFDLSDASGRELAFDERAAAEMMANHFKTEHYEIVMHAGDMERVLPELVWHLEDLRVGQSYPNYYVARLASKFVKVVLSGGGGDELFAGYPWRYYRGLEAGGPQAYFDAYYDYWQRLIPDKQRQTFFLPEIFSGMDTRRPRSAYDQVFSQADIDLASPEGIVNASLYFEIKTFLQGLFVVEDKLSMAHGLETRVPFMNNDLVDFAMRIPPRYKLRDLMKTPALAGGPGDSFDEQSPYSDGKVVLRQAMQRLIPNQVLERAKQGFSAPDESWFRGESIDYVNDLLRDKKAYLNDFISPAYVGEVLDAHISGRENKRLLIWSLLSFEWWLRKFIV